MVPLGQQFHAEMGEATMEDVIQLIPLGTYVYRVFVILCHDNIKRESMPDSDFSETPIIQWIS